MSNITIPDKIHLQVIRNIWRQRFTVYNRLLPVNISLLCRDTKIEDKKEIAARRFPNINKKYLNYFIGCKFRYSR